MSGIICKIIICTLYILKENDELNYLILFIFPTNDHFFAKSVEKRQMIVYLM